MVDCCFYSPGCVSRSECTKSLFHPVKYINCLGLSSGAHSCDVLKIEMHLYTYIYIYKTDIIILLRYVQEISYRVLYKCISG